MNRKKHTQIYMLNNSKQLINLIILSLETDTKKRLTGDHAHMKTGPECKSKINKNFPVIPHHT